MVQAIAEACAGRGRHVLHVVTPSGSTVEFTPIGAVDEGDVVSHCVLRAIQRTLNARLLATLATARRQDPATMLQDVPVLPSPTGNVHPTGGVGVGEFLHCSDRGTLLAEVLALAADLRSPGITTVLSAVAADVTESVRTVWANARDDDV